jgi:ABC-2 type transport system permease protein
MLRNIFSKTIFERRRAAQWWIVGIIALVVMLCLFYPTIRDNNEMAKLLESYPKELLAAFGMSDITNFATPAGYLQAEVFSFMVPLLLLIFAIGLGTRAIAGEEEARTLDLLLSHPVRRSQVVLQSFAALLALTSLLGLATFGALVLGALIVDMQIGLDRLAAVTLSTTLMALFFGSLALAAGAATGKRGLSMGVTASVAAVTYLINALAPSVSALKPLQNISPFYYAASSNPLQNGLNIGHALMLALGSAVLLGLAVAAFERRDVGV